MSTRPRGGGKGELGDENLTKFWFLLVVQAICVIALISFFRMAIASGAFTFIDFWETSMKVLGYAVILGFLQVSFKSVARPMLFRSLPSSRLRGANVEQRVDRTAVALFKLSYNIIIFTLWQIILDKEVESGETWPKSIPDVRENPPWKLEFLGGGGVDVNAVWKSGSSVSATTKSFFLLIVGYLSSELLLLLPERDRSDYMEMLIHHTIATGLTFFSYMCDFLKIGCLIMYVHNASDVFIYVSRSTIDIPFKPLIGALWVALCFSFLWYRLCVFPFILLRSAWLDSPPFMLAKFDNNQEFADTAWFYFNSTLSVLYMLNGYWWLLILRVGLNFCRTGKPRDLSVGGGVGRVSSQGQTGAGEFLGSDGNISPKKSSSNNSGGKANKSSTKDNNNKNSSGSSGSNSSDNRSSNLTRTGSMVLGSSHHPGLGDSLSLGSGTVVEETSDVVTSPATISAAARQRRGKK